MLERLAILLKIPELSPEEEPVQRSRLKTIYWVTGFATVFLIPFIPTEIRDTPDLLPKTIAYYLAWTAFCLIGLVILRYRRVWEAALWLALGMFGYVSYALLFSGGVSNNFLTAYLLLILIFTALFLGKHTTFFFAVIIGLSSLGLNFASVPGWLTPIFAVEAVGLNLVSWVIYFTIFSFLLLIYLNTMEARQKSIRTSEASQRRYAERLNILHQIDVAILAAKSVPEIADATLQLLHNLVPYTQAQVALFDLAGGEMLFVAGDTSGAYLHERYPITFEETVQQMSQGIIYQFDDLLAETQLPTMLNNIRGQGGRTLLIVPLLTQHELVGAIGAISTEPAAFTQEHVDTVQQIAAPLAIAIQNARLFEAEKKARQQAETLRHIANIFNVNLDRNQLLNSILEQLGLVIPFDSASVNLVTENTLQIVAHRGLPLDLAHLIVEQVPLFANVSRVLATRQPYIVANTLTDPNWRFISGREDIRCWLGVPMLRHGEMIGLLTIDKNEPDFYKEADANLALAFASQAAIAIENADLYQRLQHYTDQLEQRVVERTRDLATLYDIAAMSSEPAEMGPVLRSALETVLAALGCFAGTIHLAGEEGAFYLLHEIGVPEYVRPFIERVAADHELVRGLLPPNASAFAIKDLANTSYGAQFVLSTGELTYAGVLMRSKGNVMGVLSAVHNAGQQFAAEDLALLASIADHVAVTIENGRLHQNARQVAVMQERERMARELHDSVTQSLYSLSLFAEAGRDLLQVGKVERVQVYLNQIVETSLQALKEMRLMLYDLRSTTLLEEGLVHALRYRLEHVEERAGIETFLTAPDVLDLPADVEESLYRISQEALNNTLKHARASRVDVTIDSNGRALTMCIADNGRGFNTDSPPEASTGHGLLTMQKQVKQFGGDFSLQSWPDQGTSITINLTLDSPTVPMSAGNGKTDKYSHR